MPHTRRSFIGTSLAAASAVVARARAGVANNLTGPIVFVDADDARYAKVREIYNGAIVTRPKLIASCSTEAGVQQAVQRAIDEKLNLAVKSGGHCFEGFCLNDDGVVVDVSRFRGLHLDAATGVLTAGAGCRLADVNQFLLTKGRFLPAGSCEAVGLAGLTLGGGYGMFSRKWGLTCDHLLAVRMVDGSGRIRDSRDEPDLLWACQGGG